jgi:hypothetical protein
MYKYTWELRADELGIRSLKYKEINAQFICYNSNVYLYIAMSI